MATVIENKDQNPNDNNNLNPSGGSQGTPTSAAPISSPMGAQPPAKPASSGQYTNFGNYMQSNQNAGQRLSNLLGSNVQQQGQAVADTVSNTGNVKNAVTAENDRISQDLDKVNNAVKNTQGGDYSGFNQFLNYNQSNAPQSGTTDTSNTNPVYAGLNQNIQQLVNGGSQAQQLGGQAQDIFNRAGQQLQGLNTSQQLSATEGGRQQLLRNMLGQGGTYGQGANVLDQSLLAGNSGRLNGLLTSINNTAQGAQNGLGTAQTDVANQLQGLQQNALGAQQQVGTLAGQGLGTLDTTLGTAAQQAEQQRQQQQLDILKQFGSETFNQGTANQLGIGEGTTLFNLLKGNGQNYGVTDAANLGQFTNNPYLNLNQSQVGKANVINDPQLQAYAALQKMTGAAPESYAYNKAGVVDPAYNLNASQFDKDLSQKYQDAATAAGQDVIGGQGAQMYSYGPFSGQHDVARANVNANVSSMLDPNQIRQAATTFAAMNQPGALQNNGVNAIENQDPTQNIGKALGSIGKGVPGAAVGAAMSNPIGVVGSLLPGAINGVGSVINNLSDTLSGNNTRSTSQIDANNQALANLRQNWQNYLQNKGYTDTAKIAQPGMENLKNFNVG